MRVGILGAFDPKYPRNAVIIEGLKRVGFQVSAKRIGGATGTFRSTLFLLPEVVKAFWELRSCDLILIPTFNQRFAPIIWFLASLFQKPVLLDYLVGISDVNEDRQMTDGLKSKLWKHVDRFNIRHLPSLTDTESHRKYFEDLLDIKTDKMHILPVGVMDEIYSPRPFHPQRETIPIVFVGKFIPFQGVDIIVQAAALLQDQADLHFELIGGGQTFYKIKQLAKKMVLQNISFPGYIYPPQILNHLERGVIHLGVFGNAEKTNYVVPNKVYTSMALGRPVISAESAAIEEFFTPGEHLITIPPGNPEKLAEAILYLIENPQERERIAQAAANRIQEAFLPEHIGAQLKLIIEDVFSFRGK